MIEQTAIVTKTTTGKAWVKSMQIGGCSGCQQQSSCGSGSLAKLLPKREFCLETDLEVKVGEQVIVEIDDSHLLSASILLYLTPVFLMVLGVSFISTFLPAATADSVLPVVAIMILALVFWLINRYQAFYLLRFCFKPQISKKQLSI